MDIEDELNRVRTELAMLKESRAVAIEQEQVSRNEANRLRAKCEELESWKASMMSVESEWDPQKIGELLNLPIGCSVRAEILPAILKLITEAEKLRALASKLAGFVPCSMGTVDLLDEIHELLHQ